MSSDFEAYEQEFGTLTAEITNKIGRIPKLGGGKCCLPPKKRLSAEPRQLVSSCNASELEPAQIQSRYAVAKESLQRELSAGALMENDLKKNNRLSIVSVRKLTTSTRYQMTSVFYASLQTHSVFSFLSSDVILSFSCSQ